jgi:hypothetical protein
MDIYQIVKLILTVTVPVIGIIVSAQGVIIWFAIKSIIKENKEEHGEMKNCIRQVEAEVQAYSLMVSGQYVAREEIQARLDKRDTRIGNLESRVNELDRRT